MVEIFSTPDDFGPPLASEGVAADARFHDKQIAHAEIALALFVAVMVVIFGVPVLWRRARAHLRAPMRMPDPVIRPD